MKAGFLLLPAVDEQPVHDAPSTFADTFTDSLFRLTGEEQKVVKTTAFDLQLDLAKPGMQSAVPMIHE